MQLHRTFTTHLDIRMVYPGIKSYYENLGYRLVSESPCLVFERGSGLASWISAAPQKWPARVTIQVNSTPAGETEVMLVYDINSTGQLVTPRKQDIWDLEANNLVVSLGGALPPDGQMAVLETKMRTEARVRSGANWFYWIAGLSLVNSVSTLFGGGLSFVLGLGATQIIDAIAFGLKEGLDAQTAGIVTAVAMVMNISLAGIFVLFGIFANKHRRWAFIAGMVLYVLDGVIFVIFPDFLSIIFHLYALYGLFNGLRAIPAQVQKEISVISPV
jgi:hypothetical protein